MIIKEIFIPKRSLYIRFIFLMLLALVILLGDYKWQYFTFIRQWVSVVIMPTQVIANIPHRLIGVIDEAMTSRSDLLAQNSQLRAKNLLLEQKVQKLANLTAKNIQLMKLLKSSDFVNEEVSVAEIVVENPSPFREVATINKGSFDGVFAGQAIVDAYGVMGQVIKVMPFTSIVMLVTDQASRVPVQVNRTGYRSIAVGTGKVGAMNLLHVPKTADIKKGDLLTSSGLGYRYPEGYPLGKVKKIVSNPINPFVDVEIQLLAEVHKSRFVLLVFRNQQVH